MLIQYGNNTKNIYLSIKQGLKYTDKIKIEEISC